MIVFVIGAVVGAAFTMLAVIIIAPSRRVRQEPPLSMETQVRILLGLKPEDPIEKVDLAALPGDWKFDTQQMQALRDLDAEQPITDA